MGSNNKLTIVMYHYVRQLKNSRYPRIKALELEDFKTQIDYFLKYYNIISAYDLLDAIDFKESLPPRALLLTFDDGYIDHFLEVYPVLSDKGLSGCFFPPAQVIEERTVLDVNKVHFVLAAIDDPTELVSFVKEIIEKNTHNCELKNFESYWSRYAVASRYDNANVMFIKNMLQHGFASEMRSAVVDELFCKVVSSDVESFAEELYMNIDHLSHMHSNGMYIGSHGYNHVWMDKITPLEQANEIDFSLKLIRKIGGSTEEWIMCYPFGAYNSLLISLLKDLNCSIGLSTKVGIADLSSNDLLTLPRLDTNDFPTQPYAKPNSWTNSVLKSAVG